MLALLCILAAGQMPMAAQASEQGSQPPLTIIELKAHGPDAAAKMKAATREALRAQGMDAAEAESIASDVAEMAGINGYPLPVKTPRGEVCLAIAGDGGLQGLVPLLPGGRDDPIYEIFIAMVARHEAAHCELLHEGAGDAPPLYDVEWFEESRADAAALLWVQQTYPDLAASITSYLQWYRFLGFVAGGVEHWGGAITTTLIAGGDTSFAAAGRLHAAWNGKEMHAQLTDGWDHLTRALRASPDGSAAQQTAWESALQHLPPRLAAGVPPLHEIRHIGQQLCPESGDWRKEVFTGRYHRCERKS